MNKKTLDIVRYRVLKMIGNGFITQEDIKLLKSMNLSEVITHYNDSFKSHVLFQIYCHPYLLCNDNLIKFQFDIDIDDIADLLIKRYNDELSEYKLRLNEGDIKYEKYEFMNNQLYYLYFNSSFISERLYKIKKSLTNIKKRLKKINMYVKIRLSDDERVVIESII